MKVATVISALLIGAAQAAWYNDWTNYVFDIADDPSFNIVWGYKSEFPYGTQYLAHPGPYYDDEMLTEFDYPCDDTVHYEEYAAYINLGG